METEQLVKYIENLGADSFVIRKLESKIEQIRYSNNEVDLRNYWLQESLSIFLSKGKKTSELNLDSDKNLEDKIETAYRKMLLGEDSSSFHGINDRKYPSINKKMSVKDSPDLNEIVNECIRGAKDGGAERVTGLAYHYETVDRIVTPYNSHEVTYDSLNFEVRAFNGVNTGQEGIHCGPESVNLTKSAYEAGIEAGKTSSINVPDLSFEEGNYDTILSPYVIGNIFSYCDSLFSAYSVRSGMSYLESNIGNKIASSELTITDEPLNTTGSNYCLFDDEGTPAMNNTIIDRGTLKTFLHSFSTAKEYGVKTTANAGIISPVALQLSMSAGSKSLNDIIGETKNGLYIKNAWYTRFQDNRNAVFSTVPRDGIFVIRNGDIAGRIKSVRISDSFGKIINSITETSKERKNVKFWEEVKPSIMPNAKILDLRVTKAF